MKALVYIYIGDWGHAKRGVMWGGNQMLDEWFQGEFVFERSRVRVSGGSVERERERCSPHDTQRTRASSQDLTGNSSQTKLNSEKG